MSAIRLRAPPPSPAMACVQCATTTTSSFLSPSPKKPVLSLFSISSPSRRKNRLRQKLLKTLKIPQLPPTNPTIPIQSPPEQEQEQQQSESLCVEIEQSEETEELQTSEVLAGDLSIFSTRSVLKLGLYLIGAFVFQTICAVWVFGSVDSDNKDANFDDTVEKSRVLEFGINGNASNKEKSRVLLLTGNGNLGGSELEEKIVQIQEMAREVRESERLGSNANNGLNNDDDGVVRTGIEKEVENKLVKLGKRLQNSSEKSPVFPVSFLRKDGEVEDGVDADKPLMFRKKYKFRRPSAYPSVKPKGFMRSEDSSITRSRNSSSAIEEEVIPNQSVDNAIVDLLHTQKQLEQPNGNSQGGSSLPLEEDSGRKLSKGKPKSIQTPRKKLGKQRTKKMKRGKENGVAKPEPGIGATQEHGSRESNMLDAQGSQNLTKEIQVTKSNKQDTLPRNDILKSRDVGSKPAARKVEGKQSDDKADLWWLNLPYVLVILMQRTNDGEGPKGLYALKTSPLAKDKIRSSHTVAFEDRGDATNFCYLLQSFFEDLGDFSADIVPLSIKELDEAVRLDSMKVIVVRKGQLKLYAGQPLAEVEMALSSLVK